MGGIVISNLVPLYDYRFELDKLVTHFVPKGISNSGGKYLLAEPLKSSMATITLTGSEKQKWLINSFSDWTVGGVHVAGDKVVRAMTVSPIMERGDVYIHSAMAGRDAFLYELMAFPHSKYDDWVDAFTLGLNWRGDIIRSANSYRRPKRKHLPGDNGNAPEFRIHVIGLETQAQDRYFDRNGVGTFDSLFRNN